MLLPTGLTHWERSEMGSKENCPQYDEYTGYGDSAVIAHRMIYDFHTSQANASGDRRCDYLE